MTSWTMFKLGNLTVIPLISSKRASTAHSKSCSLLRLLIFTNLIHDFKISNKKNNYPSHLMTDLPCSNLQIVLLLFNHCSGKAKFK